MDNVIRQIPTKSFPKGSLPCVPLDSTVSALILLRGILCREKGTRNTATNILSFFASMRYRVFLKGEELDILNLNRVRGE